MKYQKIHACPNDGLLYRNEFEEMHNCPRCGVSRYKVKNDDEYNSDESTKKGLPTKVLWYLLIIPRFKCMFANANDAKEARNLRLGLDNNGMNPYVSLSTPHSLWPCCLSGPRQLGNDIDVYPNPLIEDLTKL